MASLLYTKGRNWALSRPVGSPGKTFHSKTIVPPDEQLACIDDMYAVGSWYEYEWESELSPAWRFVGRHLRYTKEVDRVADAYVRRALGVEDASQPSPKVCGNRSFYPDYLAKPLWPCIHQYIGVHIRRDDWDQTYVLYYPLIIIFEIPTWRTALTPSSVVLQSIPTENASPLFQNSPRGLQKCNRSSNSSIPHRHKATTGRLPGISPSS